MGRRSLRMLTAGFLILGVGPISASGHVGGKIQLYVADLAAERAGNGYALSLTLIDRDSGARASGYHTMLEGHTAAGDHFGPIEMAASPDGVYTADLAAKPGDWNVTVQVEATPGVDEIAAPLVETRQIKFTPPGLSSAVGTIRAPASDDAISPAAAVGIAFVGTIGVIALVRRVLMSRRRLTPEV